MPYEWVGWTWIHRCSALNGWDWVHVCCVDGYLRTCLALAELRLCCFFAGAGAAELQIVAPPLYAKNGLLLLCPLEMKTVRIFSDRIRHRIRLKGFRSIRIWVRIFNIRYCIRIRILKSYICDVDIQSYIIRHSWYYLYSNPNPTKNMKTNIWYQWYSSVSDPFSSVSTVQKRSSFRGRLTPLQRAAAEHGQSQANPAQGRTRKNWSEGCMCLVLWSCPYSTSAAY